MALAVTLNQHWHDGKKLHVVGTIVPSGNYTATGDTLDLSDYSIKAPSAPIYVEIHGQTSYIYKFVPGATKATGKMIIFVGTTGIELAAAGYPAGITGDTIVFHAIFNRK